MEKTKKKMDKQQRVNLPPKPFPNHTMCSLPTARITGHFRAVYVDPPFPSKSEEDKESVSLSPGTALSNNTED